MSKITWEMLNKAQMFIKEAERSVANNTQPLTPDDLKNRWHAELIDFFFYYAEIPLCGQGEEAYIRS